MSDGIEALHLEVPADHVPGVQMVLAVASEDDVDDTLDVVSPFETTHWGAREMAIRDLDGRVWRLQVKAAQ